MSVRALVVQELGKKYRLGQRESYGLLRDALASGGARILRGRTGHAEPDEVIWALRDVTLSVNEGEVVGVIGPNGAGKSTLLKILSRITAPTTGEVRIHGRVGSLLEVGTGFHPELTGRENIFLNGAMLGMRRIEIQRKFDEIVAFAEVERFLDTPVKRYSSGMYVRLAFSVAAHLEPEVLLVDEVLAVGDVAFQRKCLGRMGRVAHEGRTVLFVSHNLGAIRQLCPRSVLLAGGRVVDDGETSRVLQRYLDSEMSDSNGLITRTMVSGHTDMVEFRSVSLVGDEISPQAGQPITLEIRFRALRTLRDARINVGVTTLLGERLFSVSNVDELGGDPATLDEGEYTAFVTLAGVLRGGVYRIGVGAHRDGPAQWWTWVPDALRLEVQDEAALHYNAGWLRVDATWDVERSAP